jgi:hypothetical protein
MTARTGEDTAFTEGAGLHLPPFCFSHGKEAPLSLAITTSAKPTLRPTIWRAALRKLALLGHAVMASKSMVPPTIWGRGCDRVVGWIKDVELSRAKAALEQQLARIIETANGHQAKGLPSGSPVYMALSEQATLTIDDFCARHGVERLTIEQEVPALRDLEALTHAPSLVARLTKGLGILFAGIIGALVIGCASGLVTTGYHWIVRLLVG